MGHLEQVNTSSQKEDASRVKYTHLCAGIRKLLAERDLPLHAGASGADMVNVLYQMAGNHKSLDTKENLSTSWSDEYDRLTQGIGAVVHTSLGKDSDPEKVLSALRESVA